MRAFLRKVIISGVCLLMMSMAGYASITAVVQTYNGDARTDFTSLDTTPLPTNALFMLFRTTNSAGSGFNAANPNAPYYGDVLLGAYPLAQTNFPGSAGQITGYLAQFYTNDAEGTLYLAVYDCTYAAYTASNTVPEGTRYLLTTNAPVPVQESSGGGQLTDVGQAINDYVSAHGVWAANRLISSSNSAAIGLSTQQLSYAATYGGMDPSLKTVVLSNTGGLPMRYTNQLAYTGVSGWLALSSTGGELAPGAGTAITGVVSITGMSAGDYTARVSFVSSDATNSPQSVDVILTIDKANQTITFDPIGQQYSTGSVPLDATSDSGLVVAYGIASGPGLLNGSTLTFTATGTVLVTASQAGNANWNAAAAVTQSVTVVSPPPAGSLRCILYPEFVQTNGGAWRIQGSTNGWKNSGYTVQSLTPGSYVIEFQSIPGWYMPDEETVIVTAGNQSLTNGIYEKRKSPNDFDADGISDIGCYDPATGTWFVFESFLRQLWSTNYAGGTDTLPVTGDFDGDGYCDYGTYYPPSGYWRIMKTADGGWTNYFGFDGTVPVTGDFDGDEILDFGCYNAPNGGWYIFKSEQGFWSTTFGYSGTIPVTGDFDGDGIGDFGCYFPPSGTWYIFMSATEQLWSTRFGYDETVPVTGDFDGDGIDDFGCYYAQGGAWYLYKSRDGFWSTNFGYGGTLPVTGDYDGDGITDFGCYFAPSGAWYLYKSRDGFWSTNFGYDGTLPIK